MRALVGLLSLLVVIGLPAGGGAFGGVPSAGNAIAGARHSGPSPHAGVRSEGTDLDVEDVAGQARAAVPVPAQGATAASPSHRPASDRDPVAAERSPFERPPRA